MEASDPLEFYDAEYTYEYTRDLQIRYVAKISHKGVKSFRTIKDVDDEILKFKVLKQYEKWNAQYEKQKTIKKTEKSKFQSEQLTNEAENIQEQLGCILMHTLEIDDAVRWDSLKDFSEFQEEKPLKPKAPKEVDKSKFKELPVRPDYRFYAPKFSLIEKMFSSIRDKKESEARKRFEEALDVYNSNVEDVNYYNSMLERQQNDKILEYEGKIEAWKKELDLWETRKGDYYNKLSEQNKKIDDLELRYKSFDKYAIIQYCEIVLNNSDYSLFNFPKDFEIDFVEDSKTILIDYALPSLEDIPTLKEVKFIASKQDFKEVHISKAQTLKNYDNVIYQIILRTIHEIFEGDVVNVIEAVTLNGWVNVLNKATGEFNNNCIATIHVLKSEFLKLDLSLVEPKFCFQGLKGISATKLSSLTPVSPIQQINKSDNRFVESKDVSGMLDSGYNLAAMSWEDFEHLVRELFHKEFSVNGGEVKVTQSSRDGGVDAIAFDPDPIRGGKIVIQAKRYTNIVGVSAVRDLWGTTMNEGATKGILVTTSNYGSDAYDFVKDKPLTLLNGNNLLSLLEKHGFKAKIDLVEAKRINKENQ